MSGIYNDMSGPIHRPIVVNHARKLIQYFSYEIFYTFLTDLCNDDNLQKSFKCSQENVKEIFCRFTG